MTETNLPKQIPIFPLTGAILLPRGFLPLNIFEPRYREMVEMAQDSNKVIGMVQPLGSHVSLDINKSDLFGTAPRGREVYKTGCAGVISEFKQTGENQYFIVLEGISRFTIVNELPMKHQFREVEVIYDNLDQVSGNSLHDDRVLRRKFSKTLTAYLSHLELDIDHKSFDEICDEELINSLAMTCPFDAAEKQMLVEASSLEERTDLMIKIMDFNLSKHDISSEDNIH